MKTSPPIRPCPICGGTQRQILHHQTFALPENHPLAAGYDVVGCQQCGFCFADTAVTQAGYAEFYRTHSKYADSATSTGSGMAGYDADRLRDTAADILSFTQGTDKLLVDIGCANGGLLAELRKLGFSNLQGVDPAPNCAKATQQLTGVPGYVGSLSDLPPETTNCDGAILSHVLEHVRDLIPALTDLRARLQPQGWIYAEVPDASRYADYVFAPFQDFNTEHINHFSLRSLENLLRQCGFEPAKSGSKMIFSSADRPYPAVYCFAIKSDSPSKTEYDEDLTTTLETYIERSRKLLNQIDLRLREILAESPRLLIWGTGELTLKLLAETALAHAQIDAFIDGNPIKQGQVLQSRPVIAPENLGNNTNPILVSSLINQTSILQAIKDLGLSNRVYTLTTHPSSAEPSKAS